MLVKSVLNAKIKVWAKICALLTNLIRFVNNSSHLRRKYKICTDKKAGSLVASKDVTSVGPAEGVEDNDVAFDSTAHAHTGHQSTVHPCAHTEH